MVQVMVIVISYYGGMLSMLYRHKNRDEPMAARGEFWQAEDVCISSRRVRVVG